MEIRNKGVVLLVRLSDRKKRLEVQRRVDGELFVLMRDTADALGLRSAHSVQIEVVDAMGVVDGEPVRQQVVAVTVVYYAGFDEQHWRQVVVLYKACLEGIDFSEFELERQGEVMVL